MSQNDIITKIEALNEWEAIIADAQAEADAIRDAIKAEMTDRDIDELIAGSYIVRYKMVLSNRFLWRTLQGIHQADRFPPVLHFLLNQMRPTGQMTARRTRKGQYDDLRICPMLYQ